jgi:hypothetical protein
MSIMNDLNKAVEALDAPEESKSSSPSVLDKELTEALKQTFPASDPVAIGEETADKPERPVHRQPPVIDRRW